MSLVIQLPVSAPSKLGTVSSGDLSPFLPYDTEAYEFWNFRSGTLKATSDNSKSLSPSGSYSFADSAIKFNSGGSNNLVTGLADNGELSFTGVVAPIGNASGALIIAGNYTNNPVAGVSIYKTASQTLQVNAASKQSNAGSFDATKPIFFGVSISKSQNTLSIVIHQNSGLSFEATGSFFDTAYASGTSNILLGSLVGGLTSQLTFYEFATYNKALTQADLVRKHKKAQVRMSGLNVAI